MRWQMPKAGPTDAAQQAMTEVASGLHRIMRLCDGEVCLELLMLMADGERSVGAMARMMSLDLPAVSLRLGKLSRNGLVTWRRQGSKKFYALTPVVKVNTLEAFRVVTIRTEGGGEMRVAVPEELMRQLETKWREADAMDATRPQVLEDDASAEVREVDLSELAARVVRAEANQLEESLQAEKQKLAAKERNPK